jgi:hypothetical protein
MIMIISPWWRNAVWRQQHLHRFHAMGDGVAHLVDLADATGAKHAGHFVIADLVSDVDGHGGSWSL